MADIVNAMGQLPFVAGFVAGGVVFGFIGLAIGWSKGNRAGWDDGWHTCREANEHKGIHRW